MRETAGENPLPLLAIAHGVRRSAKSTRSFLASRCDFSHDRCRTPIPFQYSGYSLGPSGQVLQKRAERLRGRSLRDLRTKRGLPRVPTTPGSGGLLRGGTVPCSLAAATPWRSLPCMAAPPCSLPGFLDPTYEDSPSGRSGASCPDAAVAPVPRRSAVAIPGHRSSRGLLRDGAVPYNLAAATSKRSFSYRELLPAPYLDG